MSNGTNSDLSNGDLHGDELVLGIINAAVAFFFAPALVITLPLLVVAVWRHLDPESLQGAGRRLFAAPADLARGTRAAARGFQQLSDQSWEWADAWKGRPARQRPALSAPDAAAGDDVVRREHASVATAARAEHRTVPGRGAVATAERPAWLRLLNDEPDQRPHAIILGPTRSGKTTMATAAMADRDGRAIVITPKLNPNNWRGAEIVTLDDEGSYAPISAALDEIEQEKRRRIKVLRSEGAAALEPLTIVFDEIGELAQFEPRAPEAMVSLSSIGAELKMRIIGIGTSDEALGIKRWKATRNNYIRVETTTDRRATINDGVRTIAAQPKESIAIASTAQLRPWRGELPAYTGVTTAMPRAVAAEGTRADVVSVRVPERAPAPEHDALLAALFAEVPAAIRAEVPDIDPSRAARLASILERQGTGTGVRVERGDGGDVYVFAAAAAEGGAGKGGRGRGERDITAEMLVTIYEEAGASGRTFTATYAEHKGTKESTYTAWRRGRDRYEETEAKNTGTSKE
jgi:hypothetical protein